MKDCIFCKIAAHEIDSKILLENDKIIVFDDIHPQAPVHRLIVPKEHIPSIAHLEKNHEGVISELIYTAKKLAADAGLSGYKLVFNVGRDGGQIIDHLHLHLLGGWGKNGDRQPMP